MGCDLTLLANSREGRIAGESAHSRQLSGHPPRAGTRILGEWPTTRKLKPEPLLGACLSYRGNAGEATANRIAALSTPSGLRTTAGGHTGRRKEVERSV